MLTEIKKIPSYLPKEETFYTGKIWGYISLFLVIVTLVKPFFFLNENQILYIFSSSTQVIAAIYGLIITGYIFLRNELDRKSDKDESLIEVNLLMKSEYFSSIVSISLISLFSIFLCLIVLSIDSYENWFIKDIFINITITGIIITLTKIILFVIKILNPESLEIASNKLRETITKDDSDHLGSLEVFLRNYNQVEYILEKYGDAFSNEPTYDYQKIRNKRIPKAKLVEILFRAEKIDASLREDLIKLISFRNSLIHGTELYLSQLDVTESETTLNLLKQKLGVK